MPNEGLSAHALNEQMTCVVQGGFFPDPFVSICPALPRPGQIANALSIGLRQRGCMVV